jgi:hypothetical protein
MEKPVGRQALLDYLTCKSEEYAHSDGLMMTGLFNKDSDLRPVGLPFCERPMFNDGYDVFGVHWTRANPATHYTPDQEPVLKDIEKWREEVHIPVVSRYPWQAIEELSSQIDRSTTAIIVTMTMGPFERATVLSSFEDSLVNAISDPDNFKELIDALGDYRVEVIHNVARYAAPDIINLHDDWGTGTATFLSPELWREIIKPATKRIYDAVHEHGIIISQHSCGSLGAIVEDMVEIGADVWEAQSGVNDLDDLSKRFAGKLRILASPVGDAIIPLGYDPDKAPDLETLPLNLRPYAEPPKYLWP